MSTPNHQLATACLTVGGHTGTAWLGAPGLALTAAHCVVDLNCEEPRPGTITLTFFGGQVRVAQIDDVDVELDIALLRLNEPLTAVEPLSLGQLPEPLPEAPPRWVGYGHGRVQSEDGLPLSGQILSAHARYKQSPALQLRCEQGGYDNLHGVSGSAVVWRGVAVGLIRSGINSQEIIYATSAAHIHDRFPQLPPPGGGGHGGYDPDQVLDALTAMLDSQFKTIAFGFPGARSLMPADYAPQMARAQALIAYSDSELADGHRSLVQRIYKYAPGLAKRLFGETPP
ncbi:MAG: hypothetical protein CMH57_16075 [Myxococcales bacterium]|nr:hypothetical protein [Myxococcales bacterium]